MSTTKLSVRSMLSLATVYSLLLVSCLLYQTVFSNEFRADSSNSELTAVELVNKLFVERERLNLHCLGYESFYQDWSLREIQIVANLADQSNPKAIVLYNGFLELSPYYTPPTELSASYKKAAQAGLPEGMRCWAWCLDHGRGVAPDRKAALEWYEKAAALDNPPTLVWLAGKYAEGIDDLLEEDDQHALQLLERAIELGSPEAAIMMCKWYRKGINGLPEDEEKAAQYWKLAAESDNPFYTYDYAYRFDKKHPQRYEYLLKAADAGDARAQYELGYSYFNGEHFEADHEKGRKWLEKAALEGNNRDALNYLGIIHAERKEVTRDIQYAIWLFDRARLLGKKEGSENLDIVIKANNASKMAKVILDHGLWGYGNKEQLPDMLQYYVLKYALRDAQCYNSKEADEVLQQELAEIERLELLVNPPKAPLLLVKNYLQERLTPRGKAWQEAADAGSPIAQYIIGLLYTTGLKKHAEHTSDVAAAPWYRQSAENGLPLAQRRYGRALIKGLGLSTDQELGAKWLATSAANGSVLGIHTFAWALEEERGVEKQPLLSAHLFDYSFRHGCVISAYMLGLKHYRGSGVGSSYILARGFYGYGSDNGHAASMNNLALMLMNNDGGGYDPDYAKQLYARASRLGHGLAARNLQSMVWANQQALRRLEEQEQRYLDEYWGGAQSLHDLPRD